MAKQKPRRKSGTKRVAQWTARRRILEGIADADAMLADGRICEGLKALEALDRRYSGQDPVLRALAVAYDAAGDSRSYQSTIEKLIEVDPRDAEHLLRLAQTCLINNYPLLAFDAFARFLERAPGHPDAAGVWRQMADLEEMLAGALATLGLSGQQGREIATLHEEMLCRLQEGRFEAVRRLAERLLALFPEFTPALNNLSEACFRDGLFEPAITAAKRVLDLDPHNYHALANLTRFSFFAGKPEEASQWGERLKGIAHGNDLGLKKAEAFSYLGDDQAVLDAVREAEESAAGRSVKPLLLHWGAVAAHRLGDEDQARRYWKRALRLDPHCKPATENLRDLQLPAGQRHAPWYQDVTDWMDRKVVGEFFESLGEAGAPTDGTLKRKALKFMEKNPAMAQIVPALMDRGDLLGRELAVRFAELVETPPMLAALGDFVFGKRGPDSLRVRAASALNRAGILPSGPVELWVKGELTEVQLCGFEIYCEPVKHKLSPQVSRLMEQAFYTLRQRKGAESERILKQAIELCPDDPSLFNNLLVAYQLQGREPEATALIRQNHQRFPDYHFGRTAMAHLAVREGRLNDAKELLDPLMSVRRFHTTEFAALCAAEIDYWLACGKIEAARSWLQMWENADDKDPAIEQWRNRVYPSLARRLLGRFHAD